MAKLSLCGVACAALVPGSLLLFKKNNEMQTRVWNSLSGEKFHFYLTGMLTMAVFKNLAYLQRQVGVGFRPLVPLTILFLGGSALISAIRICGRAKQFHQVFNSNDLVFTNKPLNNRNVWLYQ